MKKKVVKSISVLCCIGLLGGLVGCDSGSQEPYIPSADELENWATSGLSFTGYDFPVMPLASDGDVEGLQVERHVSVDVTDESVGWANLIRVADEYILTNTTEKAQTFTVYYPYIDAISLETSSVFAEMPTMLVDGNTVVKQYYSDESVSMYNDNFIRSFADQKNYASTEVIFPRIEKDDSAWNDTRAYVYTIKCPEPPAPDCDYVELDIYYENPDDAKLMINELHSWGSDDAGQFIGITYDDRQIDEMVIMAFGGEIQFKRNKQLFQYHYGEECQEVVCEIDVKKETASVAEIMAEYGSEFQYLIKQYGVELDEAVSSEEFQTVIGNSLIEWVSTETAYDGMDDISEIRSFGAEVVNKERYCYLYENVEIPAGASVTVVVNQEKEGSFNHMNGQRFLGDAFDWFGFEVATSFGSNLNFTKQTASFAIADGVAVLADNFIPNENGEILLDKELHYLYYLTADSMKKQVSMPGAAAKPVIYLYPEEEMDVKVKLNLEGELTSTWPKYNETTGWNVTASPDGTLVDEDGYEYSYLFWEGELEQELDFSKGFVVKGEDSAEFFREKLSYMGLTPEEYNEFIVYWAPILEQNEYNLIAFQWDNYQDAAELEIVPAPDSMLRVYMAYQPLEKPVEIEPQELPVLERTGFTVVEWGGRLMP